MQDVLAPITTAERKHSMRKHLAVVGAVLMAVAAAVPADARLADPVSPVTRPAVTFAPGMSDAAQSGYTPRPVTPAALPPDLRGEGARAAAEPPAPATPAVATPATDGLDWRSAGLGAAGAVVLAAMTAGGVVLMTRRGVRFGASR
jgi:hypothetical protein